jgi:hypothetical protein
LLILLGGDLEECNSVDSWWRHDREGVNWMQWDCLSRRMNGLVMFLLVWSWKPAKSRS